MKNEMQNIVANELLQRYVALKAGLARQWAAGELVQFKPGLACDISHSERRRIDGVMIVTGPAPDRTGPLGEQVVVCYIDDNGDFVPAIVPAARLELWEIVEPATEGECWGIEELVGGEWQEMWRDIWHTFSTRQEAEQWIADELEPGYPSPESGSPRYRAVQCSNRDRRVADTAAEEIEYEEVKPEPDQAEPATAAVVSSAGEIAPSPRPGPWEALDWDAAIFWSPDRMLEDAAPTAPWVYDASILAAVSLVIGAPKNMMHQYLEQVTAAEKADYKIMLERSQPPKLPVTSTPYRRYDADAWKPYRAGKPYRPANGTEGVIFETAFCARCVKSTGCEIMGESMCYDTTDPEYPLQLVYGSDGQPTCTAFQAAAPEQVAEDAPAPATATAVYDLGTAEHPIPLTAPAAELTAPERKLEKFIVHISQKTEPAITNLCRVYDLGSLALIQNRPLVEWAIDKLTGLLPADAAGHPGAAIIERLQSQIAETWTLPAWINVGCRVRQISTRRIGEVRVIPDQRFTPPEISVQFNADDGFFEYELDWVAVSDLEPAPAPEPTTDDQQDNAYPTIKADLHGQQEAETTQPTADVEAVNDYFVRCLTGIPAHDVNFRSALDEANAATLSAALEQLTTAPGKKTVIKKLTGRLATLEKQAQRAQKTPPETGPAWLLRGQRVEAAAADATDDRWRRYDRQRGTLVSSVPSAGGWTYIQFDSEKTPISYPYRYLLPVYDELVTETSDAQQWPAPNGRGVYSTDSAEKLVFEHGNARVELHLLQIDGQEWIGCYDISFKDTGSISPLSDKSTSPTRRAELDALTAAVESFALDYINDRYRSDSARLNAWRVACQLAEYAGWPLPDKPVSGTEPQAEPASIAYEHGQRVRVDGTAALPDGIPSRPDLHGAEGLIVFGPDDADCYTVLLDYGGCRQTLHAACLIHLNTGPDGDGSGQPTHVSATAADPEPDPEPEPEPEPPTVDAADLCARIARVSDPSIQARIAQVLAEHPDVLALLAQIDGQPERRLRAVK